MTTIRIISGGRSYDLDVNGGRLYREHNTVVPLSKKQWDLLYYLVQNPNRLLSKEELIQNVWNRAAVTDEAVAQTIRALRRAFDDDSKAPVFIESEYGRGYRFIAEIEEAAASLASPSTTTQPYSTKPWFEDTKWLAERLLRASPDPHDSLYIAPMLLAARRLGKKIGLSERYFRSIDVLVNDIDEMRTSVTYPAPAHISVNDLEIIVDELENYASSSG